MERRRGAITAEDQRERMDIAGKRGWRAVFAGGRFEGEAGDDKGQTEETIPFTSGCFGRSIAKCSREGYGHGVSHLIVGPVASRMLLIPVLTSSNC